MLKYRGVVDKRKDQYSLNDRLHLIQCLHKWKASLYIFGRLEWGESKRVITEDVRSEFLRVQRECVNVGMELWTWMKPGDYRYTMHAPDRKKFVENALRYIDFGADGFYLLMDDMHSKDSSGSSGHIRVRDAETHALLIEELGSALGTKFKGICGQHYSGIIPNDYSAYWTPILNVLPTYVMITWTGPKVWNATLDACDVPDTGHPVLLWDNYFASDSIDPARAPICPYEGRDPLLVNEITGVVIHPDAHYPWQYCNLQTALDFWQNPREYNPKQSFRQAIQSLGDDLCLARIQH